ncbi:hypothetical protein [Rhodococcus koreensis]|uniref:hypothetical protein n=1 Tax=Rhodococcus koreensis TaxID=99653 RepID=UPI00159C2B63|nr:hypothetical protein [Rhodococcus koreensis]
MPSFAVAHTIGLPVLETPVPPEQNAPGCTVAGPEDAGGVYAGGGGTYAGVVTTGGGTYAGVVTGGGM